MQKTNRRNAHERIQAIEGSTGAVGGGPWQLSSQAAIAGIENGAYTFHVYAGGHEVDVIIATRNNVKYLKTKNDGEQPDNLLSLPECSA
ncbi:DUF3892 domain-containing protein [Deinococcus sp. HMF7604]|uniref:DUF3892 domain-containing protein n=1 Tax=Deinococcus betulae TaxID=2873312 RepID=UPI001CCB4951|nr:DUF3892 domain-containing protein [Deinococcus betulae]